MVFCVIQHPGEERACAENSCSSHTVFTQVRPQRDLLVTCRLQNLVISNFTPVDRPGGDSLYVRALGEPLTQLDLGASTILHCIFFPGRRATIAPGPYSRLDVRGPNTPIQCAEMALIETSVPAVRQVDKLLRHACIGSALPLESLGRRFGLGYKTQRATVGKVPHSPSERSRNISD